MTMMTMTSVMVKTTQTYNHKFIVVLSS